MTSRRSGRDVKEGVWRDPKLPEAPCPRPDKRAHETKRQAKKAIKGSRGHNRTKLEPYLCICGFWHVGNHP